MAKHHPIRLAVVGTSGSGKSTLAREAAQKLGINHIEQDNHFWLPNWQMVPKEQFAVAILKEISEDSWTICGNHSFLQEKIWKRATHVVWLNYPLSICFNRGLRRTFRRVFLKEECCNGNREGFRHAFLSTNSILWWILKTHRRRTRQYRQAQLGGNFGEAQFLEFQHPRETDKWLQNLQLFGKSRNATTS